MAADLDQHVDHFRDRPLDAAGPFTFVAADALTMKVREGGRVVNAVVLVGVNGDGHREVPSMGLPSETGPAWNEFFADLVAREPGRRQARHVRRPCRAGRRDRGDHGEPARCDLAAMQDSLRL